MEAPTESTHALAQRVRQTLSVDVTLGPIIGESLHRFTHRVQQNYMYLVDADWSDLALGDHYVGLRWLPIRALDATPLSKQARKTLNVVRSHMKIQT